jgi:hypothetical protein
MHNYVHHSTTRRTNIVDYGANFVGGPGQFQRMDIQACHSMAEKDWLV